jgi:hypothetical protein
MGVGIEYFLLSLSVLRAACYAHVEEIQPVRLDESDYDYLGHHLDVPGRDTELLWHSGVSLLSWRC